VETLLEKVKKECDELRSKERQQQKKIDKFERQAQRDRK
jgi:hypothetical protein